MHELIKHSGIRDTLVTSRERFWILRGREAVKQIIRKCVICRRYEGTPYRSQPSSDLPSERVSEDPPLTHVGLDFAGPLFIADKNITEGTSESSKVYVCLFTCASTRAVHLELTRGLSVQAFLLAFRRFASRRGLSLLRSRFLGCHATLPPKKRLLTSEQHSFPLFGQSQLSFHFREPCRAKFAL